MCKDCNCPFFLRRCESHAVRPSRTAFRQKNGLLPGRIRLTVFPLPSYRRLARCGVVVCALLFLLNILSGCTELAVKPAVVHLPVTTQENRPLVRVPGKTDWVATGIVLQRGEAVHIEADGAILFRKENRAADHSPHSCGPEGTYLYEDSVADKSFPLPAGAGGPAPPYCLIGRIGEGPAFYVGRRLSFTAPASGPLYLGINDFHLDDNSGEFVVRIDKVEQVQPVRFEKIIPEPIDNERRMHTGRLQHTGRPQPGCSVVIFYLDGLRPDVVREMVAMGHLPTIGKLFVEEGAWMENTFTGFPSDTITSNGTMWTGCFSDRHGLKGQVRFSRRSLAAESYLSPLGPHRSARLLSPFGMDRVLHDTQKMGRQLVLGKEAGEKWSRTYTSNVAPLYRHLQRAGEDWATGVLPLMTEVPPILWSRSLVRHMPYLQSQNAWQYMDEANTDFTLHHLLARGAPVTIVWLPETDTVSHRRSRGQFGITRRTIARADRLIRQMVGALAAEDRLKTTYLFLLSDHGHHGGRRQHLAHFDLANEVFYQPRQRNRAGKWIGGGLGLSVRQYRFWNRHPEDGSREFVFLDAESDGVARIFLPRRHYRSGRWMGEFRPADLLRYRIADDLPAVNLIKVLTGWTTTDTRGQRRHPVDLVLMKLDENRVLIATHDRGHAVIDRKRNAGGRWVYRYRVVDHLRPLPSGKVAFHPVPQPAADPLGLTAVQPPLDFSRYYDERFWLRVTAQTEYPDSVVVLSRHMLWQKPLQDREKEFAPDLVVTARRGWYFGRNSSPGTMHGYPFADSMRASLFIHGPNIQRGARIRQPCRLADLAPTILEMVGHPSDPEEFDGRPLRSMYQRPAGETDIPRYHPVLWNEVNLHAWGTLSYRPRPAYEHQPFTVNRPASPFDLNNIVYNVLSLSELNVLRLTDDLFRPLRGERAGIAERVEQWEFQAAQRGGAWARDTLRTLNLSGLALADYNATSQGNIKRVDSTIDWVQQRTQHLDHKVARKIGRPLPGSTALQRGIDTAQFAFWEFYRFGQRLMAQLLDETIINSLEDGADRLINTFRMQPAEIVPEPAVLEKR